jgi:aspartate/glutamate racemase
MSKHCLSFLHTSPAAIGPLMQFYSRAEPDWEITNLLDDGILRKLQSGQLSLVEERLREMLATARTAYAAEAVLITCSAIPAEMVQALAHASPVPLMKIDEPMARRAVEAGARIGVAVTFPPAEASARQLLSGAAAALDRQVALDFEMAPGAYDALLRNDTATHDRLLLESCERLLARGADAIVLAQVSMARAEEEIRKRVGVPVFSSLSTSLEALRARLAA